MLYRKSLKKVLSPKNDIRTTIKHIKNNAPIFAELFPNNEVALVLSEMAQDLANTTEYVYHHPDVMDDFSMRDSVIQREYGWSLQVDKLKQLTHNLDKNELDILIIMLHNVDVLKYQRIFMKKKIVRE